MRTGSYILSGLPSSISLLSVRTYNENKVYVEEGVVRNGNKFTLQEGIEYIHLLFAKNDGSDITADEISSADLMIEKGDIVTTYSEHQQTDYLLYIQQEMLEGDYFVKEADGWKEVHNYSKRSIKQDVTNSNMSGSNRYIVIGSIIANTALIPNANEIPRLFSNILPACSYNTLVNTDDIDYGITISTSGSLCIRVKDYTTLDEYKNKLSNDDFYYYYYLTTPTKLICTSEQSAVLDELNSLDLFEGINNIITAENIALLQAIYTANAKKYVDKEISDIKEQLNTINELLSTAGTSSLLLDNLQTDLESEVM